MPTKEAAPSIGQLVAEASDHLSQLIRDEMRLAQLEMTEKGKKAGTGLGLMGAGGLIGLYGLAALVAAAILGLSETLDPWQSALIVAGALFVIAAITAVAGKREATQALPPKPEETIREVRADIEAVKRGARR